MSEITSTLRSLELRERQAWQRERAHREHLGATGKGPRAGLFRRTPRRAA